MLHLEVVSHRATIVHGVRFRTRVTLKRERPAFVNLLRDESTRPLPGINSSFYMRGKIKAGNKCQRSD
jgi:hypothetical protein